MAHQYHLMLFGKNKNLLKEKFFTDESRIPDKALCAQVEEMMDELQRTDLMGRRARWVEIRVDGKEIGWAE